jgi:DNA-binding NtrC family response regulator
VRAPPTVQWCDTLRRLPSFQPHWNKLEHFAAAPADVPILIEGETGTGKEHLARCLHELCSNASAGCGGPFFVLDCAALNLQLLESELFGFKRGTFTGATEDRRGLLEFADRGVIFLDEIGELPLEAQSKLLRVVQNREFRRLGTGEKKSVSARFIAATNRDLRSAVKSGSFRADLYHRLAVLRWKVAPLRERPLDIPVLVEHMLREFGLDSRVSADTLSTLLAYDWPGNVRELRNVVRAATIFSSPPEGSLTADALEAAIWMQLHDSSHTDSPGQGELRLAGAEQVLNLRHLEHDAILRALDAAGGNKATAAGLLGIGKTTLYRKLQEFSRQRRRKAG